MNKKAFLIITLVLALVSLLFIYQFYLCYGEKCQFIGAWKAQWSTPASSFEGMDVFSSFEMDGSFNFTSDSVTVIAMGYPGCVFGVDTLVHTQRWEIRGDTLDLISDDGVIGISYQVIGRSDQYMELQLLDDIFISLEKLD